jgi:hypothetical protein
MLAIFQQRNKRVHADVPSSLDIHRQEDANNEVEGYSRLVGAPMKFATLDALTTVRRNDRDAWRPYRQHGWRRCAGGVWQRGWCGPTLHRGSSCLRQSQLVIRLAKVERRLTTSTHIFPTICSGSPALPRVSRDASAAAPRRAPRPWSRPSTRCRCRRCPGNTRRRRG